MHPMKAKYLTKTAEMLRMEDETLQLGVKVATRPREYGWTGSLIAIGVMLPLVGVSALMTEATYFMMARSSDEMWDRIPQPPSREP